MARILIEKAARALTFTDEQGTLRFRIALGAEPFGAKQREGDARTPEGEYCLCTRNPRSKYTLSLGISYPNECDARAALRRGEITRAQYDAVSSAKESRTRPPWDTPLGGFIMIHGGGAQSDWTRGCIALGDADMRALWERARLGDLVTITP